MDEPTVDEPAPSPTLLEVTAAGSGAEKPQRRWGRAVAVGLPAFLAGVILAAHRPVLGMIVRSRAAALGVDLTWEELDPGFGAVRLGHARVSLAGVHGLKVTAAALRLGRDGLSIDAVDAEDVAVTLEGPAGDRVLEVASWVMDHQDAFSLRGSARNVQLSWRARPETPAWLAMTGGSLTVESARARFLSTTTQAFGVPLGALGASFALDAAGVTLSAGNRQGAEAPVTATLKPLAHPPTLAVTLRPVDLSALGTALGVSLPPAPGATASGRLDLTLPSASQSYAGPVKAPAGISGLAAVDIDGWVPSHPHVLDTLLASKKTALRTRLRVSEDRATIRLDDLEVRLGRLGLKGSGTVTEESAPQSARLHMEIGGPVPCSELARNVASHELGGGLLGGLAADLAGGAVTGSATVKVTVEADVRDLGAAKVTPRVGVGCKLGL